MSSPDKHITMCLAFIIFEATLNGERSEMQSSLPLVLTSMEFSAWKCESSCLLQLYIPLCAQSYYFWSQFPSARINGMCASQVLRLFKKQLKVDLPYDPSIKSLGICPPQKNQPHITKMLAHQCLLQNSSIAKLWNQLRHLPTEERIGKMWSIHTQWNFLVIKKE